MIIPRLGAWAAFYYKEEAQGDTLGKMEQHVVYLDCGSDHMVICLTCNHCRTILGKVNFTLYKFFFFNLEVIDITLSVLLLMNLSFRWI